MAVSSGGGEEVPETPRCDHCGSALDDVSRMSDKEVLKHMRTEVYRDLLRSLRTGNASHQELAIARGILRDNKMYAEEEDEEGTGDGPTVIDGEEYSFKPGALSETEGG